MALLISNSHLFSKVHFNSRLQAIAETVTLNKVITFFLSFFFLLFFGGGGARGEGGIYLPPSEHVLKIDLMKVISGIQYRRNKAESLVRIPLCQCCRMFQFFLGHNFGSLRKSELPQQQALSFRDCDDC